MDRSDRYASIEERLQTPREPIPKSVVKRLEKEIQSGHYPAGRLPPQRELARSYGVSRPALREAIASLEFSGLLGTEPGRGTFIHDRAADSTAVPPRENYPDIEVCQFRSILEPQAARLAAMKITDEQIALLAHNLESFKTETRMLDLTAAAQLDFEFHHLIVTFSDIRLFMDLHNDLCARLLEAQIMPRSASNRAWEPVLEHERILEALRRRDPDEARYYMQSHITRAADRLGILLAHDLL